MEWHWEIQQGTSPNVHNLIVTCDAPMRSAGNEFRILLTADRHFDSPHSDRGMQRRHAAECKEGGWPIVDLGDFFDAMQGRYDNRRSPPDNIYANRIDYLDALVEDAAGFFEPYASQFALLARGNHDQKIRKHEGSDLMRRFAASLERAGGKPQVGGYGGWLVVRFSDASGGKSSWTQSVRIKYHHGSGGGGKVSRGVLRIRNGLYYPDAQVIIGGHIHEDWSVTIPRDRISKQGRVYINEQLHCCVPSYKEEYGTGAEGWHVERDAPPKVVGATWLRFRVHNHQVPGPKTRNNVYRFEVDAERAR